MVGMEIWKWFSGPKQTLLFYFWMVARDWGIQNSTRLVLDFEIRHHFLEFFLPESHVWFIRTRYKLSIAVIVQYRNIKLWFSKLARTCQEDSNWVSDCTSSCEPSPYSHLLLFVFLFCVYKKKLRFFFLKLIFF